MATEQARYTVVTSESPYEIRDYQSSIVASVVVGGSRSGAVNSGFLVLANYIFAGNQSRMKIAMTAPVTQIPQSTGEAAAVVLGSTAPRFWIVRFMMPTGLTLASLPAPTDGRVHFEPTFAHRAAVIRFSGFWSDANLQSHEVQLRQWMSREQLTPQSPPIYAYYDPPWTPWFMRTIEVLIDVAPPVASVPPSK